MGGSNEIVMDSMKRELNASPERDGSHHRHRCAHGQTNYKFQSSLREFSR